MSSLSRASLALLVAAASLEAQTVLNIAGNRGVSVENYSAALSTSGGLSLNLGLQVDYLIVAGGGGGGGSGTDTTSWGGGGGGGGGLLSGTMVLGGTTSVVVGAGGAAGARAGSAAGQLGGNGENSSLGDLVALGGGGGGAYKIQGLAGGSGGGGGGRGTGNNLRTAGGAGTTGQGFAGGATRDDDSSGRVAGGGGGGAGGLGSNGGTDASIGGDGGSGLANDITGVSVTYAGGGGGGAWDSNSGASEAAGVGGAGGGGAGSTSGNATSGTNGLGGGGGGVGTQGVGGAGGSGVVIVRYQGAVSTSGGTQSTGSGTAEGYTLRTFSSTDSDTFGFAGSSLGTTLSSDISGSGPLSFNSTGTILFTGAATHGGPTAINGGTLKLGDGGTGGSLGGEVIIDRTAVLEYNRSADATFSSLTSYSFGESTQGRLDKKGSGILNVGDASDFEGLINVIDGTLALGNLINVNATIQVRSSGVLDAYNGDTVVYASVVALDNELTIGRTNNSDRLIFSGGISFGQDGPGTLVVTTLSDAVAEGDVTGAEFYGANGMTKRGAAKLHVRNLNYSGATSIEEGTLVIDGVTGAGDFTVAAGATLGGMSTINGAATISGVHAPGFSPGVQNFASDLTYTSGAVVEWELAANTDLNLPLYDGEVFVSSYSFDKIVVDGDLTFVGQVGLDLIFDWAGSTVDWTDAFWTTDRSWLVFDVAGTTTGFANLNPLAIFISGAGNWEDSNGEFLEDIITERTFWLSQQGSDIYLNFSAAPIPEPSTYGLILGALALAGAAVRRRKNSK
jgi:hypothetical protein